MSLQNTVPETLASKSICWRRTASKALAWLTRNAPPSKTPAPLAETSGAARAPIIGVKKSAVCRDARGQLRTIDFFLPADLLMELGRPLDIKFLDGDEPVTAEQLGKALRSSFPAGGAIC